MKRWHVWFLSACLAGCVGGAGAAQAQLLYSFEDGTTEGWTPSIIPDSNFDDMTAELTAVEGPGNTDGSYALKVVGQAGSFKRSAGVYLGPDQLTTMNEAVLNGWNLEFDWTIVGDDNPGASGYTAQIAFAQIGPTTGWTQADLYATTSFPVWDPNGPATQTMSPSIPLSKFGDGTLGFSGVRLDGEANAMWMSFAMGSANETNETRTFYLDNFRVVDPHATAGMPGDFNGNKALDAGDLDQLTLAILEASTETKFDLNKDKTVSNADRAYWVSSIRKTYMGDSNLDGEFNSTDFVELFSIGEYEDGVPNNSGWKDGDWDGNQEFDSGDFVVAFSDGGYERPPIAQAVSAVPEPALIGGWLWLVMAGYSVHHRTRGSRPFGVA